MPKRSGQKRDFMQVAREVVERAIGEKMDGSPLDNPVDPGIRISSLLVARAEIRAVRPELRNCPLPVDLP
ncbi:MAG: hypothetical protein ACLP56_10820 [Candidatus Sulfotelmatobacter sp.]